MHTLDSLLSLIGPQSFLPLVQQSHLTWFLSFFCAETACFFVLTTEVAIFPFRLFFGGSLSEVFSFPLNSVTGTPSFRSTEAMISSFVLTSRFFSVKNKRLMGSSSLSLGKNSFTFRISPFAKVLLLLHITVWYCRVWSLRNIRPHRSHSNCFPILGFLSKSLGRSCAFVLLSCSSVLRLMLRTGD